MTCSSQHISAENIIQKVKRRSAAYAETEMSRLSPDIEDNMDVDWQLPPLAQRKLRERPKTVTLKLPAKEIPTLLASTSTVTKTSTRHELKLVSTLLVTGGADLNDVSLSTSTIYRQRKSKVSSAAVAMKKRIKSYAFSTSENKFFVCKNK